MACVPGESGEGVHRQVVMEALQVAMQAGASQGGEVRDEQASPRRQPPVEATEERLHLVGVEDIEEEARDDDIRGSGGPVIPHILLPQLHRRAGSAALEASPRVRQHARARVEQAGARSTPDRRDRIPAATRSREEDPLSRLDPIGHDAMARPDPPTAPKRGEGVIEPDQSIVSVDPGR